MSGGEQIILKTLLLSISLVVLLLLLLGLIRPWFVLWFLEKKTRSKVLKVFGLILLVLILVRILFF